MARVPTSQGPATERALAGKPGFWQEGPMIGHLASLATSYRRGIAAAMLGLALQGTMTASALAIDPPYEARMERLAEVLGSLYFLQPLCGHNEEDWRQQLADIVTLDEADDDRRQRLYGAFNAGYEAFALLSAP